LRAPMNYHSHNWKSYDYQIIIFHFQGRDLNCHLHSCNWVFSFGVVLCRNNPPLPSFTSRKIHYFQVSPKVVEIFSFAKIVGKNCKKWNWTCLKSFLLKWTSNNHIRQFLHIWKNRAYLVVLTYVFRNWSVMSKSLHMRSRFGGSDIYLIVKIFFKCNKIYSISSNNSQLLKSHWDFSLFSPCASWWQCWTLETHCMHEQNPSQHDEIGSKKQMNNVEVAKL
jgi:hypothetical protein